MVSIRLRTLTLLLCLLLTGYSYASDFVTERIETAIVATDNGAQRDQYRLKQQAVLEAKTRFPVLVEGVERLENDQYSASIEAVAMLNASASIVRSSFDAQTNHYSGVVDVTLDIEASLRLLAKLKEKRELEDKLSLYLTLVQETLLATNRVELALAKQKQTELEQDILLLADLTTIYAVLSAKEKALYAFRDQLLLHYADVATWEFTKVNRADKAFTVRVTGPDLKQAHYELTKRYDESNMQLLHGGGYLCGMSTLSVHFKADVLPIAEPGKRFVGNPIHIFEFEFVHDDNQVHVDQFKKSFKLLPCY